MKILLSKSPGPPETLVLEDAPDPEPGPGQVRLKVSACGVNYPDSLIIEDKYQFRPERPFAPGGEVDAGFPFGFADGLTEIEGAVGHGSVSRRAGAVSLAPLPGVG